jgi:hypothetical protein
VKANLYTIAPNLSGGVFIVLVCWLLDKTSNMCHRLGGHFCRWLHLPGNSRYHTSYWSWILFVRNTGQLFYWELTKYSTLLLTFGAFTPAMLIPAWLSSNTIPTSGRATTLGLITGLQNIAGIISSKAFHSQDAPVRNVSPNIFTDLTYF